MFGDWSCFGRACELQEGLQKSTHLDPGAPKVPKVNAIQGSDICQPRGHFYVECL